MKRSPVKAKRSNLDESLKHKSTNGPDWKAVFSYIDAGDLIIGIDEVGRGAWAGPVVAAAVAMPHGLQLDGLADSKLLSPRMREHLSRLIRRNALAIGIGWVSSELVDRNGLSWAVKVSGLRALVATNLHLERCRVVLDGNVNYLGNLTASFALPKADALITPVAAASVVAKVARDRYLTGLARRFPEYGFNFHKGYGTPRHIENLASYGPSPVHRLSVAPVARRMIAS